MAERAAAAVPLSVFMSEKKKQQQQQQQQARAPHPLPDVRNVIQWTLVHVGIIIFAVPFAIALEMLMSHLPSWLEPRPVETTDAEDAVREALFVGMLWCATPQAAAAVLALMLPCHRRRLRLLLAYAALVATVASHCLFAAGVRIIVVADPGGLFMKTIGPAVIIIEVVGDLLCFLGLIIRGGEE